MKKILYLLFCLWLAPVNIGCNKHHHKKYIILQPLGGYPDKETRMLRLGLLKIYNADIHIAKSIPLPVTAHYKAQNRYNADGLLAFLSDKKGDAYTVIGFTDQDIFTSKNNQPHWGIMGLGTLNADASIVSTFRLHRGITMGGELLKLTAHELGHNFGLTHCADKTCIMADAEGHNNFYRETGLCANCRQKLIDKGIISTDTDIKTIFQ